MAERADKKCWIVGNAIEADGVKNAGVAGALVVFDDEKVAKQACDMVERVSGERPAMVEGSLWRERQPRERRGKAVQG